VEWIQSHLQTLAKQDITVLREAIKQLTLRVTDIIIALLDQVNKKSVYQAHFSRIVKKIIVYRVKKEKCVIQDLIGLKIALRVSLVKPILALIRIGKVKKNIQYVTYCYNIK
jgi:hypothetical protein